MPKARLFLGGMQCRVYKKRWPLKQIGAQVSDWITVIKINTAATAGVGVARIGRMELGALAVRKVKTGKLVQTQLAELTLCGI